MATATMDKHVECAICFELFRNPHALDCLHTYCLQCIKRLENKKGHIDCPQCRKRTKSKYIKKDFKIEGIVDTFKIQQETVVYSKPLKRIEESVALKQEVINATSAGGINGLTCDMCKVTVKKVMSTCKDCQEFMCGDCEVAHRGSKSTKDHNIALMTDIIKSWQCDVVDLIQELKLEISGMEEKSNEFDKSINTLQESKYAQVCEMNRSIDDLIFNLENHRQVLTKTINEANNALIERLKGNKNLLDEHTNTIKVQVEFMSEMRNSEDLSILSDMINIVTSSFNKEIEAMKAAMAQADTRLPSPVTIYIGERYDPQMTVSVKVDSKLLSKSCSQLDYAVQKLPYKSKSLYPQISIPESDRWPDENQIKSPVQVPSLCKTAHQADDDPEVATYANLNTTVPLSPNNIVSDSVPRFMELLSEPYVLDKCESSEYKNYIQKIYMIKNELWCSVSDAIHIYDRNCTKMGEIRHSVIQNIRGLSQAHNGDVIVACSNNNGLHKLDAIGEYVTNIMKGSYSALSILGKQVYLLEYNQCNAIILEYIDEAWVAISDLRLNYNGDDYDRLCAHGEGMFISSWFNHQLYVYNNSGVLIEQTGERGSGEAGKLHHPRLCGVDSQGNALVADDDNHRLQLYDSHGKQWHILQLSVMNSPMDALVDSENTSLWVATSDKKLLKFTRASSLIAKAQKEDEDSDKRKKETPLNPSAPELESETL